MNKKINKQYSSMRVDERTHIKCLTCNSINTISKWDNTTIKEAETQEALDDYVSLTKIEAYEKETDTIYKCPSCGVWVEGAMMVAHKCIDLDEYNK